MDNILASEILLRTGIVAALLIVLLTFVHRLLNERNQRQVALIVSLSLGLAFFTVISGNAALTLFRVAEFFSVFDTRPIQDAATFFLELHKKGTLVAEILFGLWLFPAGLRVLRS